MAQLNFPDPNTTQSYTEAGITWTWNDTLGVWSAEPSTGDGDFTKAEADGYYLSKLNDDTAAGEITFEKLTTHEAGITLHSNTHASIFPSGDGIGLRNSNPTSNGTSVDIASALPQSSPTTLYGVTATNLLKADHSTIGIQSGLNKNSSRLNADKECVLFKALLSNKPGGVGGDAFVFFDARNFDNSVLDGIDLNAAFRSNLNASAAGNVYSFLSEGDAPAYFAGNIYAGYTTGGSAEVGTVRAKGYNVKAGVSAPLGGSNFNINWENPNAVLYIDDVQIGIIASASDYRTKRNVETITENCSERIKQLRPVTFQPDNYNNLFTASEDVREGFIAHEVQEVIPSGCFGKKDSEEGIQSLKLDAILSVTVKALQETIAKNEELEARIAALEGGTN
jgi:hypothetical protein